MKELTLTPAPCVPRPVLRSRRLSLRGHACGREFFYIDRPSPRHVTKSLSRGWSLELAFRTGLMHLLLLVWCLTSHAAVAVVEVQPETEVEHSIDGLIDAFGCHSIYLDVGSNIGVQIRKVFQPDLYAHADPMIPWLAKHFDNNPRIVSLQNATPPVLPIFDKYFGPAPRCKVCAIGIEPNPRHSGRLSALEQGLRAAGAGVLILNQTAADVSDGSTSLHLSRSSAPWGPRVNDVGLTPLPVNAATPRSIRGSSRLRVVRTVDLARLILFIRRKLQARLSAEPQPSAGDQQPAPPRGKIVMKLDIEGAEIRLLPHLIKRNAACSVDAMFLEWHRVASASARAVKQTATEVLASPRCNVEVSSVDDETFMYDGKPLPNSSLCETDSHPVDTISLHTNRNSKTSPPRAQVVKVFAVYWPQWHETPLNNFWFGDGYTDWELLCNYLKGPDNRNRLGERLQSPAQPPNGFGWYNLSDVSVRRRQAQLAKEYGVYGFAVYHYWFARNPSWGKPRSWGASDYGADLDETVMQLLEDGEPDIPFYFIWANEAFVWKWKAWGASTHGSNSRLAKLPRNSTQVPMRFPRESWRPHFDYLLRFFRHRNYHRIDGCPVLGLHSVMHLPPAAMWDVFQQWARESGFPGIYILQTMNGMMPWYLKGGDGTWNALWNTTSGRRTFAPWAHGVSGFGFLAEFGKRRKVPKRYHPNWTHGIIVDTDNTPRMLKGAALIGKKSPLFGGPKYFERGFELILNESLQHGFKHGQAEAMINVVSWNEWSEQSALEPSDRYGLGYLEALRRVLERHGQLQFNGKRGLWRQPAHPPMAQLTSCQGGVASKLPRGWPEYEPGVSAMAK